MQTFTRHKRTKAALLVGLAALFVMGDPTDSGQLLGTRDAHAVIGRPLTPGSYAGVARRTTRRAYYAGASGGYYGGYAGAPQYYAAPPAVATTAVVTTLPAGCARVVSGGVYYQCGDARYAPAYNGPTVVYQPY